MFLLNIQAYNTIIETISPLLEQKELKAFDTENSAYFANSERAVRVIFDEPKRVFMLQSDTIAGGKPSGSWKTLTQWLFLPDYTEKDAVSIGNDFYDTLNETLGLKTAVTSSSDVVISSDSKDEHNLEGLLQRFLIVFPQYKENYKEHVSQYGECLYVDFFEKYAVPCLKSLLKENDKKRLKKYFELLNEMYTLGDRGVSSVVSVVILGQAIDDESLIETAYSYMGEYKYLRTAVENVREYNRRHKKKK